MGATTSIPVEIFTAVKNEYELKKVKKIRQMEIPSFANSEKEKLLKKNATKGGRYSLRHLIIPFFLNLNLIYFISDRPV